MGWHLKNARAGDGTSFLHKAGSALLRLTGLGTGIAFVRYTAGDFAQGAPVQDAPDAGSQHAGQGMLQRLMALLHANLLHEAELAKGSFASVLASWGLAEDDLPCAVRNLAREALCGLLLFAVSLCAMAGAFLLPVPAAFLRILAVAASASMALAGLLLLLSSLWRRSVLQRRQFVPFAAWLSPAGCRKRCRRKGQIPKNTA